MQILIGILLAAILHTARFYSILSAPNRDKVFMSRLLLNFRPLLFLLLSSYTIFFVNLFFASEKKAPGIIERASVKEPMITGVLVGDPVIPGVNSAGAVEYPNHVSSFQCLFTLFNLALREFSSFVNQIKNGFFSWHLKRFLLKDEQQKLYKIISSDLLMFRTIIGNANSDGLSDQRLREQKEKHKFYLIFFLLGCAVVFIKIKVLGLDWPAPGVVGGLEPEVVFSDGFEVSPDADPEVVFSDEFETPPGPGPTEVVFDFWAVSAAIKKAFIKRIISKPPWKGFVKPCKKVPDWLQAHYAVLRKEAELRRLLKLAEEAEKRRLLALRLDLYYRMHGSGLGDNVGSRRIFLNYRLIQVMDCFGGKIQRFTVRPKRR